MPWIGIVSLVKGTGMSVQEHAAPESISTLANWPPKLALIFIRFPLLIMSNNYGNGGHVSLLVMVIFSRSARVVGRTILAVLFFKLIHEVYELFQQLRVVARGRFLVMLRLFF